MPLCVCVSHNCVSVLRELHVYVYMCVHGCVCLQGCVCVHVCINTSPPFCVFCLLESKLGRGRERSWNNTPTPAELGCLVCAGPWGWCFTWVASFSLLVSPRENPS